MGLRVATVAGLMMLVLLTAAPSASACHDPPPGRDCVWDNPPWGVVPVASCLALGVAGYAQDAADWGVETADELLFGC